MGSSSFWLVAAGSLTAALASCSSSVTPAASSGAGGGSSTASSSTASTTHAATASSSSGGAASVSSTGAAGAGAAGSGGSPGTGGAGGTGGADHGSFATAQPVNVNATLMESLPTGDSDYYVFTGTKGEAIDIEAVAQYLDPNHPAPFDATYLDTVVTLYDATHAKIAENDDIPFDGQDADLFTVLPADGTYYVRVTDCWVWTAESGKPCALPMQKTHPAYALEIYEKDGTQANVVQSSIPDPGNTPPGAVPLKFAKVQNSQYYRRTDIFGALEGAVDTDWFSFTLPPDTPVTDGRLTAYVSPMLSGTTHDGSTEPMGPIRLTDATGAVVLAQLAGAGSHINAPLTPGAEYLLSITRNDQNLGSNDFYALFFIGGGSSPIEKDDLGNDTLGGAEPLVTLAQPNAAVGYYVAGDLTPAGVDLDYYVAAVPNLGAGATVSASCSGWTWGSGLRGLTATMKDQNGNPLGTSTEVENSGAYVPPVAVPAGAQSIYLEVSGASQDAVVTGTFYGCGLTFFP